MHHATCCLAGSPAWSYRLFLGTTPRKDAKRDSCHACTIEQATVNHRALGEAIKSTRCRITYQAALNKFLCNAWYGDESKK